MAAVLHHSAEIVTGDFLSELILNGLISALKAREGLVFFTAPQELVGLRQ